MSVAERLDVNKNQLWRGGDTIVGEKNTNTFVNGVAEFFSNVWVGLQVSQASSKYGRRDVLGHTKIRCRVSV